MAISKPKNPNLLDDLVLNFDPFALNGLDEVNGPATVQGTPAPQGAGGEQPPAVQVTGTVVPASGTPDSSPDGPEVALSSDTPNSGPDGPEVALFRAKLEALFRGELPAAVNAEADSPAAIVGTPEPAPPEPSPNPPRPVADPDFNEVAPEAPDPGPQPTVQEGAVNTSGLGALDSAHDSPGGSGIAGTSLTDWWFT